MVNVVQGCVQSANCVCKAPVIPPCKYPSTNNPQSTRQTAKRRSPHCNEAATTQQWSSFPGRSLSCCHTLKMPLILGSNFVSLHPPSLQRWTELGMSCWYQVLFVIHFLRCCLSLPTSLGRLHGSFWIQTLCFYKPNKAKWRPFDTRRVREKDHRHIWICANLRASHWVAGTFKLKGRHYHRVLFAS